MATLTTVPTQQPAAPRRRWNTLEILSRSRAVLFALVALLVVAIVSATYTHRGAMKLVGLDTAPSIIKAQEIKSALADMDADAANELLDRNDLQAQKMFEQHRVDASEALVEAARNITFGDAEKQPIQTVEVELGTYEREVQQALDPQDSAHQDAGLGFYRKAAAVLDKTLLPAADALDAANNDVLKKEYEARSSSSFTARVFVLLLGFALALALVLAQGFLSRRTRRTLNPALVAATALTLGLTFFAFTLLYNEQSELEKARKGAFDSMHALLQARAVAYAANSDESRFLLDHLDRIQAAKDLQAFDNKTAQLATLPPHTTPEQLAAAMRTGKPIPGFSGLLAVEYDNVTEPGEQEFAIRSVEALESYRTIDRQLREDEAKGQYAEAVKLCVGLKPGDSDWAFNQFDAALDQTYKINKAEFDRAVASGFSSVANLEYEASGAGIVLAVLIFFGFAPRIREYQ